LKKFNYKFFLIEVLLPGMFPQKAEIIFLEKTREPKVLKIISYPEISSPTIGNRGVMTDSADRSLRSKWRIFGIISAPNNYWITVVIKKIDEYVSAIEDGKKIYRKELDFFSSEMILEGLSHKLNEITAPSDRISDRNKIDIGLIVVRDGEISATNCGDISMMLARKKQDGFELVDLLKKIEAPDETNKELAISFKNIVTGGTMVEDAVMISTRDLWEFIYNENLIDALIHLPPKSAVEFLRNKIDNLNDLKYKKNLWGLFLILSWRTGRDFDKSYIKKIESGKSKTSLKILSDLSQETEKILTSSFSGTSFKNTVGSMLKTEPVMPKIKNFFTKNEPRESNSLPIKSWQKKYRLFFRSVFNILMIFSAILKNIAIFLFLLGKKIIFTIKGGRENYMARRQVDFGIDKFLERTVGQFNALPQKGRIFLIIAVALSVLFAQSVFLVNSKLNQKRILAQSNQTVSLIRANLSEAEASLIYNDAEKSFRLIKESINLFESLPSKSKENKKFREEIAKEIDKTRFIYQHLSIIKDPVLITTLDNGAGKQMLDTGKNIVILTEENKIFLLDAKDQKMDFVANLNQEESLAKNIKILGIYKNGILYFGANSLFNFNIQNKIITPVPFTPPQMNLNDSISYFYSDNLYLINSNEDEFIKINGSFGSFTKSADYLKDGTSVRNVSAIAADSAIYLLDKNNGVLKYKKGILEESRFAPLDPPFLPSSVAPKMWTSENSLFLYILDPAEKRLIVYNKNGNLKKQYSSPQFDDLKDFVVNEKEKQIYLLNGNKIYGIIAEHLTN